MPAVKRCAPAFSFSTTNSRYSMDSKDLTFKVTINKAVKRLTVVFFALILIAIIICLATYSGNNANLIIPAILALAVVVSLWYSPKQITLGPETLTVKRRIGSRKIPLVNIISIERYEGMWTDIRICGIGGVFGFTGWFTGDKGRYFAYVGDHHNAFIITTSKKRKYVMSCDRPDELVAEVKRRIGTRNEA